jgi:hypothetical protein
MSAFNARQRQRRERRELILMWAALFEVKKPNVSGHNFKPAPQKPLRRRDQS